jgi:NAD(P)-dependent dehydrogenase (short-subunit alcohol dehydrogenase family)
VPLEPLCPPTPLGAVTDGDRWRLEGSVALVTGAGRGLGLGCARALGAAVLLVARTGGQVAAAAGEIVASGGRAHGAEASR